MPKAQQWLWSKPTEGLLCTSHRKLLRVSQCIVHHNLLCMELCNHKPIRVPKLTFNHCQKHAKGIQVLEWDLGAMEDLVWWILLSFTWLGWLSTCECTAGSRQDGEGSVMLWKTLNLNLIGHPGSRKSHGFQFHTCHLPKHHCKPGISLYEKLYSQMLKNCIP